MKTGTRFLGFVQVIGRSIGGLSLGALVLLGCLGAAPTTAKADISWTFNNVDFYLGSWTQTGTVYTEVADLSGSFVTNDAINAVKSSNLKVTAVGGHSSYGFNVAGMVNDYLPGTIGIYATGWSSYIDLYLTSPLASANASYSFSAGYDCPGCAVLPPNNEARVSGPGAPQIVTGSITATPEPGFYAIVAFGLSGLLCAAWRRRRA